MILLMKKQAMVDHEEFPRRRIRERFWTESYLFLVEKERQAHPTTNPRHKRRRQADDESDSDDDDSPLTLKAASKEVIPSGAQPCSFDRKVKQNRTIINRIACPTAVSIASRAFHAAEASIARSEALAAAVVANGIFGKGDSGR